MPRLMYLFLILYLDFTYSESVLRQTLSDRIPRETFVSVMASALWCNTPIIKNMWNPSNPTARFCDIRIPYKDNQSNLQMFVDFNFDALICTSLYDASIEICHNRTMKQANLTAIPVANELCKYSAVHLSRYPGNFLNETALWVGAYNRNIQNETKCLEVCQASEKINPLCENMYLLNSVLRSLAERKKGASDTTRGGDPSPVTGLETASNPGVPSTDNALNGKIPKTGSSYQTDAGASGSADNKGLEGSSTSKNKTGNEVVESDNQQPESEMDISQGGGSDKVYAPINNREKGEPTLVIGDQSNKQPPFHPETRVSNNTSSKKPKASHDHGTSDLETQALDVKGNNGPPIELLKNVTNNSDPQLSPKVDDGPSPSLNNDLPKGAQQPSPSLKNDDIQHTVPNTEQGQAVSEMADEKGLTSSNKNETPESNPQVPQKEPPPPMQDPTSAKSAKNPPTDISTEPEISNPGTLFSENTAQGGSTDEMFSETDHVDGIDLHEDDDAEQSPDEEDGEEDIPIAVPNSFSNGKLPSIQGTADESIPEFVKTEDSHFFAYFMAMIVLCIIGYLVFHNKQKILALALEGRSRRGNRRRPNTSGYRKLDSNLEEAVTSQCSSASVTHVIY